MKHATRLSVLVVWLVCCIVGPSFVHGEAAKDKPKTDAAKPSKDKPKADAAKPAKDKPKSDAAKPAKDKASKPKLTPAKPMPADPAKKKGPATTASKPARRSPFKKETHENAYAMGMVVMQGMKQQGLKPDIDVFTKAIKDVWNDKETEFSRAEGKEITMAWAKTEVARQRAQRDGKTTTTAPELTPEKARKLNYAAGLELAHTMQDRKVELDIAHFAKGMKDMLAEKPLLDQDQAAAAVQRVRALLLTPRMPDYPEGVAEKNAAAAKAFLEANKKKEGVLTTKTGLQYKVVKPGEGESPEINDTATFHFKGYKLDGKTEVCDSRKSDPEPVTAPLRALIPGLTETLQLMKVGGKVKVWIPPHLGYADIGAGVDSGVGPNEALIFEVELLGVTKSDMPPFKPREDL